MNDAEQWQKGVLFARLREAAGAEWLAYVDHAFVRDLARGTLREAAFRCYLGQDYRFLIHFARAYALAIYKASTLVDMREGLAGVKAILEQEMGLHIRFAQSWGLSEAEMEALAEHPATLAYTRYVLEAGLAGDLLDLHVALAPCIVGYAEIGARLVRDPATRLADNPYREWIETYAGDDYQAVARAAVERLDRLWQDRAGGARFEAMARTFREATRLERDFWQMGLDAP